MTSPEFTTIRETALSGTRILRRTRNLGVGCLIEAVRAATRTIDIDNVNRVLMQPHWQKETDLTAY
jgi:MSHA biogenesis protein MshM